MENEEIKEILDYLIDEECTRRIKCITIEESKQLLDYITNLQQENEKLRYNARGQVNDYFKDKYADEVLKNAELKKENETLKAKLEIGKTCGFCSYYDYKSRCEKAIEYINFVINHYKEQLETPIEDTYFDSDVNRKGYILSIIAYLQTILDTLNGSDEK